MNYFVDVFSPSTYSAFSKSDRSIAGFSNSRINAANRLRRGDRIICYVTKVSRWVGILEVAGEAFIDTSPRFVEIDDPYIVRIKVKPLVWLDMPFSVPIHEPSIWNELSFTRGLDQNSYLWTGKLRNSLNRLSSSDGKHLESVLHDQVGASKKEFPIRDEKWNRFVSVRQIKESVPANLGRSRNTMESPSEGQIEVRESIRVQAMLAAIGTQMGLSIWLPKGDRQRVMRVLDQPIELIESLQVVLGLNAETMRTIQEIDVLWLRGDNQIVNAFEVEHTTSIYSGILRMADLLALVPNLNFQLRLVAPDERREDVLKQIRRPVFEVMKGGSLAQKCTFIPYSAIAKLAENPYLKKTDPSVLDDIAVKAR